MDFNDTSGIKERLQEELSESISTPKNSPAQEPTFWSPLDRVRISQMFYKAGRIEEAKLWLERVFEGSKDDALTGLHWPRGEDHWLRHPDGLAMQAAILGEMLNRSDLAMDARVPRLARAVLWNVYSHEWRSEHAAAMAFSALAKWFALEAKQKRTQADSALSGISVQWKGEKPRFNPIPQGKKCCGCKNNPV